MSQQPLTQEIDITQHVNDLVIYFIVHLNTKIPFKKQDIVKDVLQDNTSIFTRAFQEAKNKFHTVFGLKIHQTKSKSYIIISELNFPNNQIIKKKSEDEKMIDNVLLISLALIFLNNSPLQEEKLWHHLTKLGFREGYRIGDIEIRKLIEQDFIKQLYLQKNKQNITDSVKYEYLWGERAELEYNKIEILNMTAKLFKFKHPISSIWPEQYEKATRSSDPSQ